MLKKLGYITLPPNSKYNEENLAGKDYHFNKEIEHHDLSANGPNYFEYFYDNAHTKEDVLATSWNPPKTIDVGETTVANIKRKVGKKERIVKLELGLNGILGVIRLMLRRY